jgi:hypothetical protein
LTVKNEKVRLNEIGPEDEEDPELREIMNELTYSVDKSNEWEEQLLDGKISNAEMVRLLTEEGVLARELHRRLKEYKERKTDQGA